MSLQVIDVSIMVMMTVGAGGSGIAAPCKPFHPSRHMGVVQPLEEVDELQVLSRPLGKLLGKL